jgi:hypothetical protein
MIRCISAIAAVFCSPLSGQQASTMVRPEKPWSYRLVPLTCEIPDASF